MQLSCLLNVVREWKGGLKATPTIPPQPHNNPPPPPPLHPPTHPHLLQPFLPLLGFEKRLLYKEADCLWRFPLPIIWATNQLFRLSILRPGDKFNQQSSPGLRYPCFVAKIAKWICALKCPWAGPYLIFDIVGRGALVTLNMCWVTIGDSANLGTVQQILRKSFFYCKLFSCNKKMKRSVKKHMDRN